MNREELNTAMWIYRSAFENSTRTPRSEAYKMGARCALCAKFCGESIQQPPYSVGSAEFDAWEAGRTEGMMLWRQAMEERRASHGAA